MSFVSSKLRMVSLPEYGKPPQWLLKLTNAGTSTSGAAVDSQDNIIVVGTTSSFGAGSADALIAKYSSTGTLVWARTIGTTSGNEGGSYIDIDSQDNIIAIIRSGTSGISTIVKYNSAGVFQWALRLNTTDSGDNISSLAIDSSDNILVAGGVVTGASGAQDAFISKISSAGVVQWRRRLGGTGSDYAFGIDADSSGNVYVGGQSSSLGTNYSFWIAKLDSSGTYTGGRRVQYGRCQAIKVNRLTNIVYAIGTESFSGTDVYFLTYSTGLTLISRIKFGTIDTDFLASCYLDRTGNVILVGSVSSNRLYITKRSSVGSQIWSGTLYNNVFSSSSYSAYCDSTDNIITVGPTGLVAKLHPDGLGGGTYGEYTYGGLIESNRGAVQGTEASITTFSSNTPSFGFITPTLIDNSAAISDTLTNITV